MKIAVVGASNSILTNGYFPLYRALEYPNIVDNLSLGGANCQFIPFCLEKYRIAEKYDFLITDCAISDGSYLIEKMRSSDWLYNELYTVMSAVRESEIGHLHLIFPLDTAETEYQEIHRQVCQELTVPYINIADLLHFCSEQNLKKLFADFSHVSSFIAKQLAHVVKETRKKICADLSPKSKSPCYKSKNYFFCSLPEKCGKRFPSCTKSSSLLSDDYIIIKNGDTLLLENLGQSNLESIFFWSNSEAGYYTLATENKKQNFNLFCTEAHFAHFKSVSQEPFPVNNFLKLQPGIDPLLPQPHSELTLTPPAAETSKLIVGAFLFSQTVNPPLKRTTEALRDNSSEYLETFKKLYQFVDTAKNNCPITETISPDFLWTSAAIYPQNPSIRKLCTAFLKKTDNPYFALYYVKLYLLPRKKYSMAIKILKKILEKEPMVQAAAELAACHIKTHDFENAFAIIKSITSPKDTVIQTKLFCLLYAHMNQETLFSKYAQKLLALNEGKTIRLFIADNLTVLKKYREAFQYLESIFDDSRNITDPNFNQLVFNKMEQITSCITNDQNKKTS